MAVPDQRPLQMPPRPWIALRAVWRMVHALGYVLTVAWRMNMGFSRLPEAERQARVLTWSRRLLACLGIELVVEGAMRPGAKLVVANHVSWLDIVAINGTEPCRFVSKAEVAQWPVIGRMVTLAGTLYIERTRRRDAMRVVGVLRKSLQEGHTAAVFPEGTTGTGWPLLPFHGNLLQSAIDADVPVQPVALRYSDALHRLSPAPVYAGQTSLAQSLWRVACAQGLRVTVQPLPPHRVTHADRRALAELLAQEIAAALQ